MLERSPQRQRRGGRRVYDATCSTAKMWAILARHTACGTVSGIHQTFCQQGILVTNTKFPDVFAHQKLVPAWQSERQSNCETGGRSKTRQTSDALVMKPTTDRSPIAVRSTAGTNDLKSSRASKPSRRFTESSCKKMHCSKMQPKINKAVQKLHCKTSFSSSVKIAILVFFIKKMHW